MEDAHVSEIKKMIILLLSEYNLHTINIFII